MMTVLDIFKLLAQSKRLNFMVDFDIGTPKMIEADKQRLLQVLRNFVGNALKYTTRGSIGICVRFNWHE